MAKPYFGEMDGDSDLARHIVVDEARGMLSLPGAVAGDILFNCCPAEAAREALSLLSPFQPLAPNLVPVQTSAARFGSLPLHYVECLQDRALPIASQRQIQARTAFRSVQTLDTDHSPFLSSPLALAEAICAATGRPGGACTAGN